jgi:hypothetical protein
MFCFTVFGFLDIHRWTLVSILFFGNWHMLCQRLRTCTPYICSQKGWVWCFYHVHLFVWVCIVLFFVIVFLFATCSFPTYYLGFRFYFIFVNIFLQQSTCIVFISCIVGFALSCCLLLSSCFILVHFLCFCLDFRFFVSIYIYIYIYISTCFLSTNTRL